MSNDDEVIEFSYEQSLDGRLKVTTKLPASLPVSASKGVSKAIEFGFAGMLPEFYQRANDNILRKEAKKLALEVAKNNVDNPRVAEMLASMTVQFVDEQLAKQERRESVINELKSSLLEFSKTESPGDEVISDDFLNHFWNIADRVPEDDLRKTYSRILAKEIVSPGSFSPSTIHLLTTLHPEIAVKFELFCSMSFSIPGIDFVIAHMPHHKQPNSTNSVGISGTRGEELSEFGITREDLLELRSTSLIRSMPEEEYPDLTQIYEMPSIEFAGINVRLNLLNKNIENINCDARKSTNIVSLTRTGSELRRILSLKPHPNYKKKLLFEVMDKAGVEVAEL